MSDSDGATQPEDTSDSRPDSGPANMLVSIEPATGNEVWRGEAGDVDLAVGTAREAWFAWAAEPLAVRMELLRRFVNVVRKEANAFAELIARETGKPRWEAATEVEAVMGKVEISIKAYAERTGMKKLDSALQGTAAVRHKPGTLQLPGTPAQWSHRPCADRWQYRGLQTQRENSRDGRVPCRLHARSGYSRRRGAGVDGRP